MVPLTSIAAGPEKPKCVNNQLDRRSIKALFFAFALLDRTLTTQSSKVIPDNAFVQGYPPTKGTNAGRVGTIVCPSFDSHW
jgi:hypothetical protein